MENLDEIVLASCIDSDGNITPTMKVKDAELYCEHYDINFCPYRNEKLSKMYCNYFKHQSIIIGSEYDWVIKNENQIRYFMRN